MWTLKNANSLFTGHLAVGYNAFRCTRGHFLLYEESYPHFGQEGRIDPRR
jgi:hypothetical protein